MRAAAKFAADPRRRAMIGKVKVAQKQLGMAEDDYRALIQRVTGGAAASCSSCTEAQLDAVLAEMERLGFRPVAARRAGPAAAARPADHPVAQKARALWISLYNLGAVGSATEASLEAFAKRQLGVERLQWADQAKGYKLIEALKAMAERAGWRQGPHPEGCAQPDTKQLLVRLIERQVEILQAAGDTRHHKAIVNEAAGWQIYAWNMQHERELRRISGKLGERVRAGVKKAG